MDETPPGPKVMRCGRCRCLPVTPASVDEQQTLDSGAIPNYYFLPTHLPTIRALSIAASMDTLALVAALIVASPFLYYQYRITSWAYDTYAIAHILDWRSPARTTVPFYAGALLFISTAVYGVAALASPGLESRIPDAGALAGILVRCLALIFVMVAKGYLGPAVAGYVLGHVAYACLSGGYLQPAPLFGLLLDWVFGPVSDPLQLLYTIIIAGNGLLGPMLQWSNPLEAVSQ